MRSDAKPYFVACGSSVARESEGAEAVSEKVAAGAVPCAETGGGAQARPNETAPDTVTLAAGMPLAVASAAALACSTSSAPAFLLSAMRPPPASRVLPLASRQRTGVLVVVSTRSSATTLEVLV